MLTNIQNICVSEVQWGVILRTSMLNIQNICVSEIQYDIYS